MPDLILHRLAFGGFAFEPVTEAGMTFLEDFVAPDGGLSIFTNEDACMAGFSDYAVGFEPQDFGQVYDCAAACGLTVEPAA